MSEAPPYRADYDVLIWQPGSEAFLMVDDALPALVSAQSVYAAPGLVQAQALERGLPLRVLRRMTIQRDIAANRVWLSFEAEWTGQDLPAGARWATRLEELQLTSHRELVAAALGSTREPPALRPQWARRGWWAEALAWVDEQLEAGGATRLAEPEQTKTWQISSLCRINTSAGWVYFKAVPPFFQREVTLTLWLAQHAPLHTATLIATDAERGWMLMHEFTGAELHQGTPLPELQRALRDYAELQIGTANQLEGLREAGCADRPLEMLPEWIHDLLWDESVLLRDHEPDGLSSVQIERLRALEPELQRRVQRLAELGLPVVLEHGDLWQNNVCIVNGRGLFYDWTDGNLTHPMLSLPLGTMEPDIWGRDAVMNAYLEPWARFLPLEKLREALELAQPLSELHRAISYQRSIIPNVEDRAEWASGCIWHLRCALDALK